jgi:hypothetical protein
LRTKERIKCANCDKVVTKNEIGLTKKYLGRNSHALCLDCLAEFLEITTEELLEYLEEFKSAGCTMFE